MSSRFENLASRRAFRRLLVLGSSAAACLLGHAASAQSNTLTLPPFTPGHHAPAVVLGGVEPLQIVPSGKMIATQGPGLQPPASEPRVEATVPKPAPEGRIPQDRSIEQAKPNERPDQPIDAPRIRRPEPDRPNPPQERERPRIMERPRDAQGPRDIGPRDIGPRDGGPRDGGPRDGGPRDGDRRPEGDRPREGDRPNGPENRGPEDRRGPGGFPGMQFMQPRQNFGMGPDGNRGNPPPRGPGDNNMGPNRGGPDVLEEQLRSVERIFNSPMIKRYLELMQENAELRAQMKMQEKLFERERAADRQPAREEPRGERERDQRAHAERAEREAHEQKTRAMLERLHAENRELVQLVEKLETRLKETQSMMEKKRSKEKEQEKD